MADVDNRDNHYRVVLENSANAIERVLIEATPELVETRNVNYKTVEPIHAPGQIYAYVNSTARTFNLSGVKLVSRTREEAEKNLKYLWLLRSWTLPEFGAGGLSDSQRAARKDSITKIRGSDTETRRREMQKIQNNPEKYGTNVMGTPPTVLLLTAYSSVVKADRGHIHRVPVIIQNLSIPYPADVDYFPSAKANVPMPTIMTIDLTLAETHSPAEYERFSLAKFKTGELGGF